MPNAGPHISNVSPWPGPPLSLLLRPCDRVVILTGAGVSTGCGLPTGRRLATWLRTQPFAMDVDFSALDRQGRGEHAGYVANRIVDHDRSRREQMAIAVAGHIDQCQAATTPSRVISAIAATPVGVVLTLNYDTLVEVCAEATGRTAHSLTLEDIPELRRRHHWLPCSYPVGDYAAHDAFCELLVTCDQAVGGDGPMIERAGVPADTVYAARRLIARDESIRKERLMSLTTRCLRHRLMSVERCTRRSCCRSRSGV